MMFLLTCDKKLTKSQLSPTHASTKRKITDELKHKAVRLKSSGQSVGRRMIYGGKDLWNRCVLSLEWKKYEPIHAIITVILYAVYPHKNVGKGHFQCRLA